MPRAVNKVASKEKRKKFLKLAKGFWGRRKNVWTIAKHHIEKALQYQYRDRRLKKRHFRRLWIIRINAACRMNGINYSRFMGALKKKNIEINRKILADFAMNKPEYFAKLVKFALG